MKPTLCLLFAQLFACALSGQEAAPPPDGQGAKEIFFNLRAGVGEEVVIPPAEEHHKKEHRHPPKPPAPPAQPLSLRYWIELRGPSSGEGDLVTESRTFKSGERIRFNFSSSTGGHISLAQRNQDGTLKLLFPNAAKGLDDTSIKPLVDRMLPSEKAWFKFDDKPSTERIVILFAASAKKLDALVQEAVRSQVPERVVAGTEGSKDLVLEVEETAPTKVGTYLISRDGRPILQDIELKHQ
jgi:hypothetical protein